MISVIVPVYNEEKILAENLPFFEKLAQKAELIFVDGKSSDNSVQLIKDYGRILECERGRALQMNHGARQATTDICLFLHADNKISLDGLILIERCMRNRHFAGGCLTQRIDKKGVIYRIIETQGNMRARLSGIFYGDQGIFVRKSIFFKIGGFPEAPIMEDVLLTKRLRGMGKTAVLPEKVIVSARRWEKKGIIKTALLYNYIILLFRLGFPLAKIKLLYDDLR